MVAQFEILPDTASVNNLLHLLYVISMKWVRLKPYKAISRLCTLYCVAREVIDLAIRAQLVV